MSEALDMRQTATGVQVRVRVIPRAGKSTVAGIRGGALIVRVAAPPVDGAANDELVRLVAKTFDLPRRRILVVAGATSRDKWVAISAWSRADVLSRLSEATPAAL